MGIGGKGAREGTGHPRIIKAERDNMKDHDGGDAVGNKREAGTGRGTGMRMGRANEQYGDRRQGQEMGTGGRGTREDSGRIRRDRKLRQGRRHSGTRLRNRRRDKRYSRSGGEEVARHQPRIRIKQGLVATIRKRRRRAPVIEGQ